VATVAAMAASDYISLVQHQQVRYQRYRPTSQRHTMERPVKRVREERASGLAGGKYNYGYQPVEGNIPPVPHPDKWGEQYGYGSVTRGSGF